MDKLVEKNNKGAHNLVYPFDTLPQPGRMLKIDNGVYWVRMSLPFALNHINLWVLKDDNGWVVVDTGVASADIKSNWRKCFSGDMNGDCCTTDARDCNKALFSESICKPF